MKRPNSQVAASRFLSVQFQHPLTEIDDGHPCSRRRVQDRLPSSTRRQTQDVKPADAAWQPAATVERFHRLKTFLIGRQSCKLASIRQPIPCFSILPSIIFLEHSWYFVCELWPCHRMRPTGGPPPPIRHAYSADRKALNTKAGSSPFFSANSLRIRPRAESPRRSR